MAVEVAGPVTNTRAQAARAAARNGRMRRRGARIGSPSQGVSCTQGGDSHREARAWTHVRGGLHERRGGKGRAMASAAILDVDGTLVDTNYHHTLAWYRAF